MVFGGPPEESNLNFGVGASAAKSWEKSKSFRHESFRIKGIQPPELETKEDFLARNGARFKLLVRVHETPFHS